MRSTRMPGVGSSLSGGGGVVGSATTTTTTSTTRNQVWIVWILMVILGVKLVVAILSTTVPVHQSYYTEEMTTYGAGVGGVTLLDAPVEDKANPVVISACLPLDKDHVNTIAIAAWLRFHQDRWGLTHVDVYVPQQDFESLRTRLESSTILSSPKDFHVHMAYHIIPPWLQQQQQQHINLWYHVLYNQCLRDAQARQSSYMMVFGPDQFLTSDQYESIPHMFANTSPPGRPAIGFPIFYKDYNLCTDYRPTFGVTKFRKLIPLGSQRLRPDQRHPDDDPPDRLYTDPPSSSRKYIIRPNEFTDFKSIWSIVDDPWKMSYFSGRASEGQDVKIIQYQRDIQISKDHNPFACGVQLNPSLEKEVKSDETAVTTTTTTTITSSSSFSDHCPYVTKSWNCTTRLDKAFLVYVPEDDVTRYLAHIPLANSCLEMYAETMCYAKRYPSLIDAFCIQTAGDDNEPSCHYHGLYDHFIKHGSRSHLVFECRDRDTKPVPTMVSRIASWTNHHHYQHHYTDDDGNFNHLVWNGAEYQNVTTLNEKDLSTNAHSTTAAINMVRPPPIHFMFFETVTLEDDAEILPVGQVIKAGMNYSIVGKGKTFQGFGTKWSLVRDALQQQVSPESVVVISDSRDVLLNVHSTFAEQQLRSEDSSLALYLQTQILQAYKAITMGKPNAVVMSAESQCCVAALTHAYPGDYFDEITSERRQRACESDGDVCDYEGEWFAVPWEDFLHDLAKNRTGVEVADAYLNAGLVVGTAKQLIHLIELADMDAKEDDQAVFTDLMYRRPDLIVLDYAQEIFGNARWTLGMKNGGCVFEPSPSTPGRLQHKETKAIPLMLHTPGGFFDCFDWMSQQLDEVHKDPHNFRKPKVKKKKRKRPIVPTP